MPGKDAQHVIGVDFTSAPSRRKPITAAHGLLKGATLSIARIDRLPDFTSFEQLLATPGPWTAALDLPFGLPRELVTTLQWPAQWPDMVEYVATLGKTEFGAALTAVRESRPMGSRYIARQGDRLAGSSSPMKLVNPPVAYMFFEGAPRIKRSGACVIPCAPSLDTRVVLEGYPGFLARKFSARSYKKDGREGRLESRRDARQEIVDALQMGSAITEGLATELPVHLVQACVNDGSGDLLDAVLCSMQAAIACRRLVSGDENYGIPATADPLEGWIVTAPAS